MINKSISIVCSLALVGCASLTSNPMTPVSLSFIDDSFGECKLTNKRGYWNVSVPSTVFVRRSDDPLRYRCNTEDGRTVDGDIVSRIGNKMIVSAISLDFGITDAITDKHREYPASFIIPVKQKKKSLYSKLQELDDLRLRGWITDYEFSDQKKRIIYGHQ